VFLMQKELSWKSDTKKVFVICGHQTPWITINITILKGSKQKLEYWSVLNVVLRILNIWLFSQHNRSAVAQALFNTGDTTDIYCYCRFLRNSFLFIILKDANPFQFGISHKGFFCRKVSVSCRFSSKWQLRLTEGVTFVLCC
jgi:hypothetical protein